MPVEIRPLFRPDAIRPLLATFQLLARVETCRPKLHHWRDLIESGRADQLNEQELLPDFLSDIFGELLGYTGPASGREHYTISREAHVAVDGKYADAVLGQFAPDRKRFVVAVEGKSARDPLDRAFAGGENRPETHARCPQCRDAAKRRGYFGFLRIGLHPWPAHGQ